MMKRIFLLFILSTIFIGSAFSREEELGTLVIIGGALRYDNAEIFNRIITAAGGSGSRVAVFPTASGSPEKYGGYAVEALRKYGAEPVFIPLMLNSKEYDYREVVRDESIISELSSCSGVYFTGGAQERIVKALLQEDGSDTPLLQEIRKIYNRGGVIAGTSAGAAIMSRIMIRDAMDVFQILKNGVEMGQEVDHGLGFIADDFFVDQHFFSRGRFARTLVVMQEFGFPYGFGVAENTALLVQCNTAEVIGYKGVLYIDMAQVSASEDIAAFNLEKVKLSYLDRGDRIDLLSKKVTPHTTKFQGIFIDPNANDFQPYYEEDRFYNDMLGNSALIDLLFNFIDNDQQVVSGLVFRTDPAGITEEQGYCFDFSKKEDSLGYYSGKLGGENYTVLNIYLTVYPVKMKEKIFH